MRIGIGIDTGGTYTDAVVYDFENKEILGTAKALTTRHDLTIGILEALDALPAAPVKEAVVVALSTTLATNACVEDKGGSAKLIFFGGDGGIIDRYGKEYGLPPAEEIYIQESYTKYSGEMEKEPDWNLFSKNIKDAFHGLDGVGIVERNAMRNSALVEKKAKELFLRQYDIPVVCGHELFDELNSLQRGSSTLLNARLFPVIREFMDAIKSSMAERGIDASVVIVRSDGSLMSEAFAQTRPIDTLLCGPAASAMGSACLTQEKNHIVVDMGGTTTDISLIHNGAPCMAVDGIRIGKWRTFADGLYIKTFGLGGDSAIHVHEHELLLEEYRVVPLCAAAAKYPRVLENLRALVENGKKHTKHLHEHYILVKDGSENARYTREEHLICAALKDGALSLEELADRIPGRDLYSLDVARLLKEGVIQVCGLTPTDLMHIRGDFSKFPAEASHLGAQYVALNAGISVDELCARVYDAIKRKLYLNIVTVMLENKDKYYLKHGVSKEVERFILDSYENAKSSDGRGLISMAFTTEFVLTGVGAPIHVFLADVAKLLGTKAVLPKHYEVANALGAVIGNVYATSAVEIKPNFNTDGIAGYTVFGKTQTMVFETLAQAEEFAVAEATSDAHAEAVRRGAKGEIAAACRLERRTGKAKGVVVELGTKAVAQAVGAIGF
ncbi:MAG: hydantoinase/oxoprolinase family protein [Christensenellales bacterium]